MTESDYKTHVIIFYMGTEERTDINDHNRAFFQNLQECGKQKKEKGLRHKV